MKSFRILIKRSKALSINIFPYCSKNITRRKEKKQARQAGRQTDRINSFSQHLVPI